jgi:hypothetical protein
MKDLEQAKRIARYINASVKNASAFSLRINKDVKKLKKFEHLNIECVTVIVFKRSSYGAMKTVFQAVEKGLRNTPQLPHYLKTIMIEGIPFQKHIAKDVMYFGFPVFSFASTVWKLDGKKVEKETLRPYLQTCMFNERKSKDALAQAGQVPFRRPKVSNIEAVV